MRVDTLVEGCMSYMSLKCKSLLLETPTFLGCLLTLVSAGNPEYLTATLINKQECNNTIGLG
jgi:hypothetical protein